MMGRIKHRQLAIWIGLLLTLFVCLNLSSSLLLRQARLDLTQNKLYTLSAGSHEILQNISEPIALSFYYSQGINADYPALRQYAQRVRDMLDELVNASNGQLSLTIIDPEPFSEEEDMAVKRGLVGRPLASGELVYFGLIGTNMVDDMQVIPIFPQERAQYLEYDLVRLIDNLNKPRRPVLGVLSNLPLDTGAGGLLLAMRGQSQPFLIYSELVDRFEVEFLNPKMTSIPSRVDVLLIAHPRPMADAQLYAVDQFVMRGGRVIAFIDPHSEVSLTAGPNGEPLPGYSEQSNMDRLMRQWGVQMDDHWVLADRKFAQRVATGRDARRRLVDYVLWMGYGPDAFTTTDVVLSNIDLINIGSPGILTPLEEARTVFTPLVQSSAEAMKVARMRVAEGPDPDRLVREFVEDGVNHVIAARLSGSVDTAFPNGAPDEAYDGPAHLQSVSDANIIIFADSDFFDDRFWTTEQNYLGQRFAVPMADNAKFLLNAVENMMGSDALISLRGRERVSPNFTRVSQLRRRAEEQFLAEEQALQDRVAAAQSELNRLEQTAALGDSAQSVMQRYRLELQEARKALRRVEGDLRRDIERLGTIMRWMNIALMPVIVLLLSFGLMLVRRRNRARTQQAGGFRMVGKP